MVGGATSSATASAGGGGFGETSIGVGAAAATGPPAAVSVTGAGAAAAGVTGDGLLHDGDRRPSASVTSTAVLPMFSVVSRPALVARSAVVLCSVRGMRAALDGVRSETTDTTGVRDGVASVACAAAEVEPRHEEEERVLGVAPSIREGATLECEADGGGAAFGVIVAAGRAALTLALFAAARRLRAASTPAWAIR